MIDFDNISDADLATCVDRYIERAMSRARTRGFSQEVHIMISAYLYSSDKDFKVSHSLTLGSNYGGTSSKSESNNILSAIDQLVPAMKSVALEEPNTIRPMLTAPVDLVHSDA